MNLREALAAGFNRLHASPSLREHALHNAAYLLRHILNISRASFLANYDRILTPEEQAVYEAAVTRRLTNEPMQYIIGTIEFYGLPLRVTPAVLIPRHSTESLVELVLEEFKSRGQTGDPLRIVDVGAGSGAIAIALAHHLPHAQLTALDLSPEAVAVAASNAQLNSLGHRIRPLRSDLLSALAGEPPFDAVVSNPPYIPSEDRDTLHPQIRDFEPEISLYGGADGLEIYHRLIPQARAALKPSGLLAIEIGHGQRDAIAAMLSEWNELHFVDDLQQIPRIALARKPE
jgi:release factor glutamine methyltransferase